MSLDESKFTPPNTFVAVAFPINNPVTIPDNVAGIYVRHDCRIGQVLVNVVTDPDVNMYPGA